MPTPTQVRPSLRSTMQQAADIAIGAVLAQQLEDFAAAGTMDADKDLAVCDATAGAFALTLPGFAEVLVGKPYNFVETSGIADVTLTAAGTGTIDGAATLLLLASTSLTLIPIASASPDAVTWVRASSSTTAGTDADAVHVNVDAEISGVAAKAVPVDADFLLIEDSANGDAKASITIGTLPIAQAQVSSAVVQVASDAAAAILDTTGGVQLAGTTAGAKVIATTSSYAGQKVHFVLLAAAGGSYTLALDVGTLTLDDQGESAVVQRDAGDTAWVCVGLSGATIV